MEEIPEVHKKEIMIIFLHSKQYVIDAAFSSCLGTSTKNAKFFLEYSLKESN